jgi:hypothetical protein
MLGRWQKLGWGYQVHGITETDVDEAATGNRRGFRRTRSSIEENRE